MPTSFVVRVTPQSAFSFSQWRGPALHAVFLARIRQHDAALASQLHDALTAKPFVLSDLIADAPPASLWRWTALDDATAAGMQAALAAGAWHDSLMGVPFHFQWEPNHPLAAHMSYEALRAADEVPCSYELTFATPTSFKVDGEFSVLPTPRLLLASALQRWNQYAPLPLAPELANLIEPFVRVEEAEVRPCRVRAGRKEVKGFTGRVVLRLSRRTQPELAQVAHCLLMYLTFCGAGVKTAMGLGMVVGRAGGKAQGRPSRVQQSDISQDRMAPTLWRSSTNRAKAQ